MEDLKKKLNILFSKDEAEVLKQLDIELEYLDSIEDEQYKDEKYINGIIQLLLHTTNNKIRDKAAMILYELNNPKALLPLIDVIKRKENKGKRSTLIWSCSRFDNTPYLPFFIDLAIEESYEAVLTGVIPVINNMEGYFYYKDLEMSFLELLSAKKSGRITPEKEPLIRDLEYFLIRMIDNPNRIEKLDKLIDL